MSPEMVLGRACSGGDKSRKKGYGEWREIGTMFEKLTFALIFLQNLSRFPILFIENLNTQIEKSKSKNPKS